MALQSVFDSLIPYFVCRTVLETQLEERKQAVTDAQAAGKEAKRAYHRAACVSALFSVLRRKEQL